MKKFSVAEAAKELGCSVGTVYGLCAARRIRHERIGVGRGKIVIREDFIEEYRKSAAVGTKQEETASMPPTARVKLKHLA